MELHCHPRITGCLIHDPKDIDTSNSDARKTGTGGNIHIESSGAILTGKISTKGQTYYTKVELVNGQNVFYVDKNNDNQTFTEVTEFGSGGTIFLNAKKEIKTGDISSVLAGFNNGVKHPGKGGDVSISNQTGNIIVDGIYTGGTSNGDQSSVLNATAPNGGNIQVVTPDLFRVVKGGINTTIGGSISIEHGGASFVTGYTVKFTNSGVQAKSGFTFKPNESGSVGLISTDQYTNGIHQIVYTDEGLIKSTDNYTGGVRYDTPSFKIGAYSKPAIDKIDNKTQIDKIDNKTQTVIDNNQTNTDANNDRVTSNSSDSETQAAKQKSAVRCDRLQNASDADPCQKNSDWNKILQILNSKK